MTSPRDYFKKARPAWQTHPMVLYWVETKEDAAVKALTMQLYRPKEGLTYRPADIYVFVKRFDNIAVPPQKVEWEDALNDGLVHLQVRAVSKENEAERFALMLQSTFAPIEAHFGETFFSAVFPVVIARGPFGTRSRVAEMLRHIRAADPSIEVHFDDSWKDFLKMVDNAMSIRWEELTDKSLLAYLDAEAEEILEGALAQYIDERFNISNRELLGW